MNGIDAIRGGLNMAEYVGLAYVNDLSDAELLRRPHPKCNHLNFQLGHLVTSENAMMNSAFPGKMPALPEGMMEKYAKEAGASDNSADFLSKEQLMATYRQQRDATLALLAGCTDDDLAKDTGIDYAPKLGDLFRIQGEHWLMHCGQWVVVRRELDKPIVI
ncbi:MAG: DinB family protein [Planctomycetales bacterium]|nr:DinB family protein [Planctomycetales bacterium]